MYSYEFFNSFTLIALSKSTESQEVKFEDETANQLNLKQHLVIGHMVIGHTVIGHLAIGLMEAIWPPSGSAVERIQEPLREFCGDGARISIDVAP